MEAESLHYIRLHNQLSMRNNSNEASLASSTFRYVMCYWRSLILQCREGTKLHKENRIVLCIQSHYVHMTRMNSANSCIQSLETWLGRNMCSDTDAGTVFRLYLVHLLKGLQNLKYLRLWNANHEDLFKCDFPSFQVKMCDFPSFYCWHWPRYLLACVSLDIHSMKSKSKLQQVCLKL